MLDITPEQLAAMEEHSEAGFRRRLFGLLRDEFPDHAGDPRGVAAVVDLGIADARAAGLRTERGLAAWVIAAFLLGLDIKDDPHVIAAIRTSGDSEAAKADWLQGYVAAVAEALEG